MNINFKKIVDRKHISLDELSKRTGLSVETMERMYYKGIFDGDKVSVQGLSELVLSLDIKHINELVPEIK